MSFVGGLVLRPLWRSSGLAFQHPLVRVGRMAEVTLLLGVIDRWRPPGAEDLLPLGANELRRLASNRMA